MTHLYLYLMLAIDLFAIVIALMPPLFIKSNE